MAKPHQLTIYLIDGSKETYNFISETEIDNIRTSLLKDIGNSGLLSLMTEDKRMLSYPLTSILKISISNLDKWQQQRNSSIINVRAVD